MRSQAATLVRFPAGAKRESVFSPADGSTSSRRNLGHFEEKKFSSKPLVEKVFGMFVLKAW
jgi:hypothetical protein